MNLINICEWIELQTEYDLVELPNSPIKMQLENLNTSNTGVGFIFGMVPMVIDNGDDEPSEQLDFKSWPVIKLHNNWYKILDDNIEDVFGALIRYLSPNKVDTD